MDVTGVVLFLSTAVTVHATYASTVPEEGLKCFKCSSVQEPEICGIDFRLTAANTSYIVECDGSCFRNETKNTFKDEYVRGCKQKGPNVFSISLGCRKHGQTESCTCNKNLCNSAVQQSQGLSYTLAYVLLSTAYYCILH